MRERPGLAVGLAALWLALFATSCAPARSPCSGSGTGVCSDDRACVGGTCLTLGELPPRTASRVVVRPVAIACVRAGPLGAASPRDPLAQLGGEHGGKLLLRFSVPLAGGLAAVAPAAPEGRLIAAHLILTRLDLDPPLSEGEGPGVVVRTLRIVDAWEENAVTWANQPRTFDVGLPSIRVPWAVPHGRLRLDVLSLVKRWPHHDPSDQGIAVEGTGSPAMTVALAPLGSELASDGPELELYYAAAGH